MTWPAILSCGAQSIAGRAPSGRRSARHDEKGLRLSVSLDDPSLSNASRAQLKRHGTTNLSDRLKGRSVAQKDGCILWAGHLNRGYGTLEWLGVRLLAHRAAWICARGPIPDGLCVCHTCDVPACINPDHLFLGTPAENAADMVAKERQLRGTKHNRVKLTEQQVREIRASTLSGTKTAAQYGIGSSQVYRIRAREKWVHL